MIIYIFDATSLQATVENVDIIKSYKPHVYTSFFSYIGSLYTTLIYILCFHLQLRNCGNPISPKKNDCHLSWHPGSPQGRKAWILFEELGSWKLCSLGQFSSASMVSSYSTKSTKYDRSSNYQLLLNRLGGLLSFRFQKLLENNIKIGPIVQYDFCM